MCENAINEGEYITYEVCDNIPSSRIKVEEYYRYYDMGDVTQGLTLNDMFSYTVMVLAHKTLCKAIENDLFDQTSTTVFDTSKCKKGSFSAYIVQHDIAESSIKKNDILILDIAQKNFSVNGLYIIQNKNRYVIKYLSDNSNNIVARVCEIQRKL